MRIEQIFGAVAVIALLVIGAFAMTGGRTGGASAAPTAAATDGSAVLIGEAGADACTCYEQAFATAQANPDILSTAYEAGYGACRDYAGAEGGAAWSWGYSNGIEGKASKRSCRAFRAMQAG